MGSTMIIDGEEVSMTVDGGNVPKNQETLEEVARSITDKLSIINVNNVLNSFANINDQEIFIQNFNRVRDPILINIWSVRGLMFVKGTSLMKVEVSSDGLKEKYFQSQMVRIF